MFVNKLGEKVVPTGYGYSGPCPIRVRIHTLSTVTTKRCFANILVLYFPSIFHTSTSKTRNHSYWWKLNVYINTRFLDFFSRLIHVYGIKNWVRAWSLFLRSQLKLYIFENNCIKIRNNSEKTFNQKCILHKIILRLPPILWDMLKNS